jgi:hypothetical protein
LCARTPTVQERLNQQLQVDHIFSLAELLGDEQTRRRFANRLVRTMLGQR